MSVALSSKPVVVLDWGWIRQRQSDHLPNQYHYLVPEIAIAEALGADADPTRFADKLRRAFALNQSRVFIAGDIRHALRFETTPTTLVALDDLVVSRVDDLDEQGILFDREYWRRVSADSSEALAHDSKPKEAYDNFRREFGQIFRHNAAERQRESGAPLDWDAVQDAVLAPNAIWTFVQRQFPAYDTPEWREVLCVFPDRHAIGRFVRLSLWQLLRAGRLSAETKLRNDWEDIQYAFMASYSSQFWTRDRDLAKAVEQLFPSVRVCYEVLK